MAKIMKIAAVLSCTLTAVFILLYNCLYDGAFLTLSITFATISYHFVMRLLVGLCFNVFMGNKADYTKKRYTLMPFERRLYARLRVKEWKKLLPTYSPENFSLKNSSFEEIAMAMCQAEAVHETIVVLSFLPLAAYKQFGAFYVFLATSVLAAAFDMLFVVVQRFNRDRVVDIILKKKK